MCVKQRVSCRTETLSRRGSRSEAERRRDDPKNGSCSESGERRVRVEQKIVFKKKKRERESWTAIINQTSTHYL